ncbi:asparagine synthase [Bacteroides zoogleoformans]|uniref:asparagine synthase (glutamine-hydrolyzing) n=1 Tax=Bacteroides zoogleoformans TaxID=28119 RepID=A0ABN5IH10_9BACE|nr:asparagine synthetase B family protein [Bacteroides zoogleoformans]AVM52053.1 asparagine synthase [Bacteroides zoogleoformans]TWJ13985.1 asparagine synthase [Bacteroides zoogleoformans]
MIYGKITLENWRTILLEGEEPESSFESCNLRVFFYGTLYNRDTLQATPDDTNAKLVADAFLRDQRSAFSLLDGSFTIVYYSENECGVVRDHHGTHYPIYCMADGSFSSSWQELEKRRRMNTRKYLSYDDAALIGFLQRGILGYGKSCWYEMYSLPAGEKICLMTEAGVIRSFIIQVKYNQNINDSFPTLEMLKHSFPSLYEKVKERIGILNAGSPFSTDYKVVWDRDSDVEALSKRYGELHVEAIRRRIGDSRRVGVLLSGGYDSGSNLAALRSIYDGQIDSYSVGFKGDAWTELPMARLMSETFGTRHHEYEIDGTEIRALPDIVRFLGEPFVEGGLMVNYCAMRMIGDDKPDVILGGDGNDQYFGTSGREVALHYLAARAGLLPLMKGVGRLLECEFFDTGGKFSRIRFHLDKIVHILEGERFGFSNSALRTFMYRPSDFHPAAPPRSDLRSFRHLYTQHARVSDLEIVIDRIILFKASRMARMFHNNLTFPFMDLKLYRFLQNLPVELKCKGDSVTDIARGRCTSKFLLKHHYKPLLPEAVTSCKKQGGFAPMPLFFRDNAQRARFKEFILSSGIYCTFLRQDVVEKFLTGYDREVGQENSWFWHRQNKALQYFNLLTLVTWWEEFVENREVKL